MFTLNLNKCSNPFSSKYTYLYLDELSRIASFVCSFLIQVIVVLLPLSIFNEASYHFSSNKEKKKLDFHTRKSVFIM